MFRFAHELEEFGVLEGHARMDWARAVARKGAIVDRFRAELTDLVKKRGVDWITEPLRFEDAILVEAEIDSGIERFPADVVLAAAGRAPNTEDLGLDRIGVRLEKAGIRVNDFLETDAEGAYAVGDVHGRFQLTPIATYEA